MFSLAGVVLCTALAAPALTPPSTDPTDVEAVLRRAKNEYAYGNYEPAAEMLRGLLYPIRLSNDEQVIETRKYLALSYFLLGKFVAASEEFGKLLYLSPDFQLDPYTVPPPIIELLELVRTQRRPELDAIRQRKSDEKAQVAAQRGFVRHVEQTMFERSELGTLLPFGVGQFQNGEYGWGTVFAAGELALVGINIACYLVATSYGPTYSTTRERSIVDALTVGQYASLALFGITWSLGVYQARLSFQPVVTGPRIVHDEPVAPHGGALNLQLRF
jgi:tetratricopeptide (TPR) repeat protein